MKDKEDKHANEWHTVEELAKQKVSKFSPYQKKLIDFYLEQIAKNGELKRILEDKND